MKSEREAKKDQEDKPVERQPSYGAERYPGSLQENLLTALFHKPKSGKIVLDTIDPKLFEGDYRVFAERAIAYWRRYNKPPKTHDADLFADILEDPGNARAKTYHLILLQMLELKDTINPKFVRDQLREFTRRRQIQGNVIKVIETLDREGSDAADAIWREQSAGAPPSTARVLTTRSLDQFQSRDVEWLWWPFVPLREVTVLFGEGGVGKSTIILDAAVRTVAGKPFPHFGDEPPERTRKGSVLLMTKEDDPESVIRPRLEAAGADEAILKRIHIVGFTVPDDADDFEPLDRLDTNMALLEQKIKEIGDVKLVAIDPATDFCGNLDIYRDSQVRALITPLARIARRYNLTVIITIHLNKKEDLSARNRAANSVAFINAPRSAVLVATNPNDDSTKVMAQVKHNLTGGHSHAVSFHTKAVRAVHKIVWGQDWLETTADEVLARKVPSKLDRAKELLEELLADGPMRQETIQAKAKSAGISKRTLDEAKSALGVKSIHDPHGPDRKKWSWKLPHKGARRK